MAAPGALACLHAIFVAGALALGAASTASAFVVEPEADRVVTIVVGGDLGFNRSRQTVEAKGVRKDVDLIAFADALADIAPDLVADFGIANLETVVTDRNDLRPEEKQFNFRSHPEALRAAIGAGLTVFSLANNHGLDYGADGLLETLRHVEDARGHGLRAAAGAGKNREQATRAAAFEVKGVRMLFGSLGIVTQGLGHHRAAPGHPGQAGYNDEDFAEVTRRLAWTPGDYRILSAHYGAEMQVRAEAEQIRDWREIAVKRHGIDLVLGHHPHVPQGVERVGNKVIFYGLGNFLHHGTADMAGKGICRDWGLLGRIHLVKGKGGRLELRAIEALPLDDMHRRARRLPAAEASARIHALNSLSRNLGGEGAEPVLFTPQADGRGLYCVPGAETESGPIGALCKDYVGAPETPAELRGRIAGSCGGRLTPRRETPEVATLTERAPRKLRRSGARSKAAARRKRVRVARSRSPVQLRRSSRGFDGAN